MLMIAVVGICANKTASCRDEGGGLVSLLTQSGEVLVSASELAEDALAFIARTGAFYVREVPGLDDEEKVALMATLVAHNVLRVGA
jgi:hypothetical protein